MLPLLPAAPAPRQDPALQCRSVTPPGTGQRTLCLALLGIVPGAGTGSPGPLGAEGCSRAGAASLVLQLVANKCPFVIHELEGARSIGWHLRLAGEACPCACRCWHASKPCTPSPRASSFPPPATRAGFLISTPLYIQIVGAQNGNVQVSS